MAHRQKCEVCGKPLEVYPCNDGKGVFTFIDDTDATGTKTERVFLCRLHALEVQYFIMNRRRSELTNE